MNKQAVSEVKKIVVLAQFLFNPLLCLTLLISITPISKAIR